MDRMLAVGKVTEIEAAPHLLVSGMSGDVLNPTMRTIRKRHLVNPAKLTDLQRLLAQTTGATAPEHPDK